MFVPAPTTTQPVPNSALKVSSGCCSMVSWPHGPQSGPPHLVPSPTLPKACFAAMGSLWLHRQYGSLAPHMAVENSKGR